MFILSNYSSVFSVLFKLLFLTSGIFIDLFELCKDENVFFGKGEGILNKLLSAFYFRE